MNVGVVDGCGCRREVSATIIPLIARYLPRTFKRGETAYYYSVYLSRFLMISCCTLSSSQTIWMSNTMHYHWPLFQTRDVRGPQSTFCKISMAAAWARSASLVRPFLALNLKVDLQSITVRCCRENSIKYKLTTSNLKWYLS